MTDGDDDAGVGGVVVPRPRRSGGPVRLVGGRDTDVTAATGNRSGTAVLDAVAPPWLRVPSGTSDAGRSGTPDAGPSGSFGAATSDAAPRPAVHRPAVPPPAVLRAVVDDPPPLAATAGPVPPVGRPGPHHPARARPPVAPEPGILGLSRLTRGRVGSRLFTLFFVAVFAVILVQMSLVILYG